MAVKLEKYMSYELNCDIHKLTFRWNEEYSNESFLDSLRINGWDYVFRDANNETFYCPECLKELNLSAGKIDVRGTIK